MSNDQKISFSLRGIKELSYSYKDPTGSLDADSIEGKFNINYRWNLDQDIFAVVFDFSYSKIGKESEKTEFLKLSIMTEFLVKDLKKYFTVRSNRDFDIDKSLEITIVSLTISTARGILFEKTKGTLLSNFILPLINPTEVLVSKKLKATLKKTKS